MKMPAELFKKYSENPLLMDAGVRKFMGIPDNRYYSVTTWPEDKAGEVFIDNKRFRDVKSAKISKSDQKT